VPIAEGPSKRFRAKQPVRPRLTKKLLPEQNLPEQHGSIESSQQIASQPPTSPVAGPSKETLAAAGPSAHKIWQFMPTPGLNQK
ncbi:hypothetical protein PIB30_109637, partial [Stylosanthes scabra]|nr:hypothetical protein [Stylosanthes scabra]